MDDMDVLGTAVIQVLNRKGCHVATENRVQRKLNVDFSRSPVNIFRDSLTARDENHGKQSHE